MRWPSDAVMLVCARPGEHRPEQMDSVNPGHCRDCGCDIVYDGFSMRRAMESPLRRGRPVEFFCIECAVQYDYGSIGHIEDHRRHKDDGVQVLREASEQGK